MTSTAVRVALRVRPLTQKEQLSNCTECLSYIPNEPQILIGTDKSFTYDHVFDTSTAQDTVYASAAGPLVQKFMDGFNATILAYGQTGSGKTYSMGTGLENSGDPENEGIVPRCIHELFEKLDRRAQEESGFSYEVAVSFLELYNEELIDLLNPSTAQKRKSLNGTVTHTTEVTIREDIAGNIYWSGVREEPCHSPEELLGFLAKGSLCRTTGSTDMNAVSSRSHAIFSVILRQHEPDTEEQTKSLTSKFHFVDLAGSERLKRTNAQGDRAREGIAINAGLLALGNVISALGDDARRTTHIPYRDSKLTRLLQDSLGGNSQTMMLACVSPADTNFMETLNTLKYANRARNIKNRVTINQDFAGSSIEVNQLKALVGRLRMEIAALRAEGGGSSGGSNSGGSGAGAGSGKGTTPSSAVINDDQVRALKSEIGRLRDRIDDMSANLVQVTSERDTLVLERELDEFISSNDNASSAIEQHPIIAQYQKKIQDLANELADTRDRLAFVESVKPSITVSVASNGRAAEPSVSTRRRRQHHRRKRGGRMSATSSSTTTAIRPIRSKQNAKFTRKASARPTTIVYPDIEEDEGFVNDIQDDDIRKEVKNSIAKARDEIRKGMEVLELIKPLDDTAKAWEAELQAFEDEERRIHEDHTLTDEGTFSATPSPIGHHDDRYRSEVDLMDEIEELAVPVWEDTEKPTTKLCDAKSVSTAEQSVESSSGSTMVASDKPNPQMVRMLHQIQSDIRVKEELVSHLEKSENEYIFMRRKFDDRISQMQTQLVELQRERDEALDRTKSRFRSKSDASVQQKEKQQLIEIRHAYEAKTKHLLTEIQDLRRKYMQMTSTMQATRNQNETLLRSLRANVDTLQVEKKRMIKRMRIEAERVREQMSTQERRIHQLQRQQAEANMAKRRLEREHETQKQMLKKRNEEILINHNQLKQMTNVLKKAVREGGILDERLLGKVSHIIGGNFAIVARGRGLGFGQQQQRRTGRNRRVNPIPVQERAARKKDLLDKALAQFIQGKQAIVEMEQLLVRRERLANEKLELLEERKHIYLSERENAELTGQPMDMMAVELMDERVDLMSAEISYLSARIRALQSEAAGESMDDDAHHAVTATAARIEKHVTFADEIITDPAPTDEWADMDAFEEQFSVPSNAAPELAYDMTVKLLKSLESDECKRIAEALVDDIMTLRMSECNRQVTQQNLEKTVMDLRRTLIVMKRAAIATTVENERRIRKLEERSVDDDLDNRARSPTDAKIEEYINGGNTIFDKIYEDGLRGLIATPEPGSDMPTTGSARGHHHDAASMSRSSTASPQQHDQDEIDYLSPSLAAAPALSSSSKPPQPLKHDPEREITPSPDRFYNMIQKRMSWQQHSGGSESPVAITMISPAEFARYAADQDSSTSSIHSSHLRRSSGQSDYSSSLSQQSWSQQQYQMQLSTTAAAAAAPERKPRQRLSLREMSMHGSSGDAIPNGNGDRTPAEYYPPLPPSSPLANYSSTTTSKQYKRRTMPAALPTYEQQRSITPASAGNVFARLSQTPTRASRAKMAFHRHSSGSVEDLKLRWDALEQQDEQQQQRSASPFY